MTLPRYEPMLASAWPGPFSDPAWRFEPKWDGVRVILTWDGSQIAMRSRRGTNVTHRYPELHAFTHSEPCVIDGEVVAPDAAGRPSFQRIQQRMNLTGERTVASAMAMHPVEMVVFDLLHLGGASLVERPLVERHEVLDGIALEGAFRRSEPAVDGDGEALWDAVLEQDLEGMVAKRLAGPYRPGVRSQDWRKIHNVNEVEVVVGGYTAGERGRSSTFGALLVGLWDGRLLRWAGAVGTGFSDDALRAIRSSLDEIRRDDPPFHDPGEIPGEPVWVEPRLVAKVGYRDWTDAGRLRHPRFVGFSDTPPESVVLGRS